MLRYQQLDDALDLIKTKLPKVVLPENADILTPKTTKRIEPAKPEEYQNLFFRPHLPDTCTVTHHENRPSVPVRLPFDIKEGEYKPPEVEQETWKHNDAQVLKKIKQIKDLIEMTKTNSPAISDPKEIINAEIAKKKYLSTLENMQKKLKDIEYKYFTLPSIINRTIKSLNKPPPPEVQEKLDEDVDDNEEEEEQQNPKIKTEVKAYRDVLEEIRQHVMSKHSSNENTETEKRKLFIPPRKALEMDPSDPFLPKRTAVIPPILFPKSQTSKNINPKEESQKPDQEIKLKRNIQTIFSNSKPPIKHTKQKPMIKLPTETPLTKEIEQTEHRISKNKEPDTKKLSVNFENAYNTKKTTFMIGPAMKKEQSLKSAKKMENFVISLRKALTEHQQRISDYGYSEQNKFQPPVTKDHPSKNISRIPKTANRELIHGDNPKPKTTEKILQRYRTK